MQNEEVLNIKKLMHDVFEGTAWHGPSVMKVLEDINAKVAFKKFEKIHTIAELTDHMATWKTFAIERLRGNDFFEITEATDWKTFPKASEEKWKEIKNHLIDCQKNLLAVLDKISDFKLSELVHNKAYDYYTLLHGVIQHDIYHAGQISLLKK